MSQLHNRINKQELKDRLQSDLEPRSTVSFYRYVHILNPTDFRDDLYKSWQKIGVFGRIYVANEGINAQISLPTAQISAFTATLEARLELANLRLNWALDDGKSFFKLDIKVREKIVADGIDDPNFDSSDTGQYLDAQAFNALYEQQPDLKVVDMRNHYETEVGHIKGAILPDVDTFREQLPVVAADLNGDKNAPIVMYCTGGIRCEKATAYMKYQGYTNVFHLEGGIINYARQCREQGLDTKFIGKNFVFDDRLGERITDDIIAKCHQCGEPADTHTNCANKICNFLLIQCEACARKYEGCCSSECQRVLHLPLEAQKILRKSVNKDKQVYKKGRW